MSKETPRLGVATTRQLVDEIEARLYLGGDNENAQRVRDLRAMLTPDQLNYSTWKSYVEFAEACGGEAH